MRSKAFTLIELLVVISVLALLLGILMPALNKAKGQADKVVCRLHLRQYGLATMVYTENNNGYLPDPHYWLFKDPAAPSMGQKHCQWHNDSLVPDGLLWSRHEPMKVHMCPTFYKLSKRHGREHPYHDSSIAIKPVYSYSMNAYLGLNMYNGVLKVSQVRKPSEVFLFTEENMWTTPGVTDAVLNDTVMLSRYPPYDPEDISDTFGTMHSTKGGDLSTGYANLLYVDGHVDWIHIGKDDIDEAFELSWPKSYLP